MSRAFAKRYAENPEFRAELTKTYFGKPLHELGNKIQSEFTGSERRELTYPMIGEMMAETQYRLFRNTDWQLISEWQLFMRRDIITPIERGYLILSDKNKKRAKMQYYHPNEWFYTKYIEPEFNKKIEEREGITKVKKIV